MIFVVLGTQQFQFNRLLIEMDRLVSKGIVQEKVFAQTGHTKYVPKHFKYSSFLTFNQFITNLKNASLVITHGGTGSIISALKQNKTIIAIPRLKKYREHVDNHQQEIVEALSQSGYIIVCNNVEDLGNKINIAKCFKPIPYVSGNDKIISILQSFVENSFKMKK